MLFESASFDDKMRHRRHTVNDNEFLVTNEIEINLNLHLRIQRVLFSFSMRHPAAWLIAR